MTVDVDALLPLPGNLCKRLKYTPTEEEFRLLSDVHVKELTIFYEVVNMGMPDEETLDKILYFLGLPPDGRSRFNVYAPLPDEAKKHSRGLQQWRPTEFPEHIDPLAFIVAEKHQLEGGIEIEIKPSEGRLLVAAKSSAPTAQRVAVDFSKSENLRAEVYPETTLVPPLTLIGIVPAGKVVGLGKLIVVQKGKRALVQFNASTGSADTSIAMSNAIAQSFPLGDKLSIDVEPEKDGFAVFGSNTSDDAQAVLTYFNKCQNLMFVPRDEAANSETASEKETDAARKSESAPRSGRNSTTGVDEPDVDVAVAAHGRVPLGYLKPINENKAVKVAVDGKCVDMPLFSAASAKNHTFVVDLSIRAEPEELGFAILARNNGDDIKKLIVDFKSTQNASPKPTSARRSAPRSTTTSPSPSRNASITSGSFSAFEMKQGSTGMTGEVPVEGERRFGELEPINKNEKVVLGWTTMVEMVATV